MSTIALLGGIVGLITNDQSFDWEYTHTRARARESDGGTHRYIHTLSHLIFGSKWIQDAHHWIGTEQLVIVLFTIHKLHLVEALVSLHVTTPTEHVTPPTEHTQQHTSHHQTMDIHTLKWLCLERWTALQRWLLYRGGLQCLSATYRSTLWGQGGWLLREVAALHSDLCSYAVPGS